MPFSHGFLPHPQYLPCPGLVFLYDTIPLDTAPLREVESSQNVPTHLCHILRTPYLSSVINLFLTPQGISAEFRSAPLPPSDQLRVQRRRSVLPPFVSRFPWPKLHTRATVSTSGQAISPGWTSDKSGVALSFISVDACLQKGSIRRHFWIRNLRVWSSRGVPDSSVYWATDSDVSGILILFFCQQLPTVLLGVRYPVLLTFTNSN